MTDWTRLVSTTISDYMAANALQMLTQSLFLARLQGRSQPLCLIGNPVRRKEPRKSRRQLLAEKQDRCSHDFSIRSRGKWKCDRCGKRVSGEYAEGYQEGRLAGEGE